MNEGKVRPKYRLYRGMADGLEEIAAVWENVGRKGVKYLKFERDGISYYLFENKEKQKQDVVNDKKQKTLGGDNGNGSN